MHPRTPPLRTWLLVSAALHAAVLIPGQFFVQRSPRDSMHGQVLVAFARALPDPERAAPPPEPERSPISPTPPLEPEPVSSPPEPDDLPLLQRELPLSPLPVPDPELFASLGFEPLERLRAPAKAAPPQPIRAIPAATAPAPNADLEVGEPSVSAPVALSRPWPDYPRISLRLGQEGCVLLRIEIAADGGVRAVIVEESSGFQRLDRAAVLAVRAWRFRPAQRAGTAVAGTIRQRITFRLSRPIR